jgi:glycine oxidase
MLLTTWEAVVQSKGGKESMRVAVIGGGVIGSLTAFYLHKRGASPIIIERGRFGHESSWAGAGILCPIHPWLYPDSFTHLVNMSLAMYSDLSDELMQLTGNSIEWFNCGLLIPFFDDDSVDHRRKALQWSHKFNWPVQELNQKQVLESEPLLSDLVNGGLFWPDVGQVRNPRLLQAVRKALDLASIEVREGAEVTGLLEDVEGHVSGVRLADGGRIDADAVLLAAGSWSGELALDMGLNISVEPVKGQIALVRTEPGAVRHIIKHDDAYFVPRQDGRVLIGASMERVGFVRGNTGEIMHELMQATSRIIPALAKAEVEQQWMGFRPGSPDGLPYLGPVENRPGLWVATGHYRNGVALAPGTADIMSRWMTGEAPELDLHDFRVDRPHIDDAKIGFPA